MPTKATAATTTTTSKTTEKPIILVAKSVFPAVHEIASPLSKFNDIPNEIANGSILMQI